MSKIYSCVIVEDSLIESDLLISQLHNLPSIEIKAVFEDGLKALHFLSENEIDIVISDIEMPYLKGIDLLKVLKTSPAFIFITSHTSFAVEGFELNAVDYIVKPINFSRLKQAISKAINMMIVKSKGNKEAISESINLEDDHFYIRENSGITKLSNAQVLYIESLSDFSRIYMQDGKVHIVLANLKSIETQLPNHQYKRIHRQFIININKISSITLNEVILDGNKSIPLGSTYKQNLMETVNNKIISRS